MTLVALMLCEEQTRHEQQTGEEDGESFHGRCDWWRATPGLGFFSFAFALHVQADEGDQYAFGREDHGEAASRQ